MGEGVTEPSIVALISVVYRVIIEVIFQTVIKQTPPSPVNGTIVEFSTEAHGHLLPHRSCLVPFWGYSPLYSISLVPQGPTQLIWA